MVADGVHRRSLSRISQRQARGASVQPVWWCAATLALLIDADVAGAFTDVLRALAEAARDRV
jgi:hypothetical protein